MLGKIPPMRNDSPYRKFQDLIFQQLQEKQMMVTQGAVDDFVQYAAGKGFTLDQLVELAKSGMSGADLWQAVHSN
jgi:hypothetical protein